MRWPLSSILYHQSCSHSSQHPTQCGEDVGGMRDDSKPTSYQMFRFSVRGSPPAGPEPLKGALTM